MVYRIEDGEWKIFHRHADELTNSPRRYEPAEPR
jgi:hypothetical protein